LNSTIASPRARTSSAGMGRLFRSVGRQPRSTCFGPDCATGAHTQSASAVTA